MKKSEAFLFSPQNGGRYFNPKMGEGSSRSEREEIKAGGIHGAVGLPDLERVEVFYLLFADEILQFDSH